MDSTINNRLHGPQDERHHEEVYEEMMDILTSKNLKIGDIVWAKTDMKSPAWPAVIINPQLEAPEKVLKEYKRRRICVMFYGYVAGKIREYAWVWPSMIFGFIDNKERFKSQRVGGLKKRFAAAINEVTDEWQPKYTVEPMHSFTVESAPSSLEQRNPPMLQHDGHANMVPINCLQTQAGIALHISSPDISRRDDGNSSDILPEELPVFCKNLKGVYLPQEHLIACHCSSCIGHKMTPYAFEKHSSSLSKDWKRSIYIEGTTLLLNKWIESKNVGAQIKQSNAQITVRQKIDVLQVASLLVLAKWTVEKCAVCWYSGDSESDKMIVCSRCLVAVHQRCYGALDVNDITSWVCNACENSDVNEECCFCPIKGGALKRADVGDFCVHVTCAMFQPQVLFSLGSVIGIQDVPLGVFGKTCVLCEQTHGACTRCFMCCTYYHATCALRAGYCVELSCLSWDGRTIRQPRSYCSNHRVSDLNAGSVEIDWKQKEVSSSSELPSNRKRLSRSCAVTDLTLRNFEGSCARQHIYQKGDKRRREESDAHLVMEHHHLGKTLCEQNLVAFPSIKERLRHLKKNENQMVCLGASGIHGWGLFAQRAIEEGEWIIEYLGELIRLIVCDGRERRYQSENKDCYFFQVSDQVVIDATKKGNLARFINHSCKPNCFARKLYMGETTRLIFIAKEKIIAGQELTLDYMFEVATNEENRVPCSCDAQNCRGYMA